MSWAEFLSRLLQSTHKVEKAVVFNVKGQPVATTEDLQVTDQDGRALLSCLQDPARTITRITLDETDFRCFQGNDKAVIGISTNKAGRVLVARLTEDALIVVMGNSAGHGSFLFELQQNLIERARRQMAPQRPLNDAREGMQQAMSQRKVLPLPSAVRQEEVLVQLHD